MINEVVISGTGLFTPEASISNEELVASYNAFADKYNQENAEAIAVGELAEKPHSSPEFISKASGVNSRYVMEKEGVLDVNFMRPHIKERSNDELSLHAEISIKAINEALENAGKTAQDVDMIIAAASNFPRAYPALAIEVQSALGVNGFSYDMNVACSSATFGIQAAYNTIAAGNADCVVVVNPEITSGHNDFTSRDCHFIFGDVCTAIVLERADKVNDNVQAFKILGTKLTTEFSNSIRNNFGYLMPCDTEARTDDKLFAQEGRKVFKEVVPMVSELITSHLNELSLNPQQDVKYLWLHQANINMNNLICKRVTGEDSIEEDRAPVVLDQYANTSSAGSIIAFHSNRDQVQKGDKGLICSFGAGYSIGNVVVEAV